jgi:hypothetical protein
MKLVMDNSDLPELLPDVTIQDLIEGGQLVCEDEGSRVVIELAKGVPKYVQQEVTRAMDEAGIQYTWEV